ncbi:MAG: hypothetical protein OXD36_17360 [Rhodobacter sp.]|nr:hypothetical protein [Rhodobacter sp.]
MRISKLYMPAVTLAGALALAGCGGGSDTPTNPGGGDKTPKELCEERGTGYTYTEEGNLCTPPATPKSAAAYEGEATAAIAAANKLVKDATEANDALTAATVDGVSNTVMTNAVMVRGAPASIEAEIAKAQAALDALEARTDADSMAAAKRVKEHITGLEKMVAPRSALVRNAAAIKASGKGSPEQRAQAAAAAVHADLSGLPGTARAAVAPSAGVVPATGVFGAGNSRTAAMVRLAGESMEGLTSPGSGLAASGEGVTVDGDHILTGFDAYCDSSTGCKAVTADGTIGAGWIFVPTGTVGQNYYMLNPDGTAYSQAAFVEWGLWVNDPTDDEDDAFNLNRFAGQGVGSATRVRGNFAARTDENGLDAKATYKGTAHGLASRLGSTSDGSERKATQSGQFGATVSITAEFAAGATELDGTIDQFTGGIANPNWKVEFEDDDYDGSRAVILADSGTTQRVTVDNYGKAAERPAGLFGVFEKTWDDGAAAGIYHAPKE